MTDKDSKPPKDLNLWGFDQWQQLHQKNPDLYEQYRQQLLLELINQAPKQQRARLKGLLFTMDGEKRRSASLYAEQVRYYALMMDSLAELNSKISALLDFKQQLSDTNTAQILPFKSKNK